MAGARSATGTVRGFVLAGLGFFVLWQLAVVAGTAHRLAMVLAIHGFVFHVIFGKGYSLLPAYFDRQLAIPWMPTAHLPLSLLGTALLGLGTVTGGATPYAAIGAAIWGIGAILFVGTVVATMGGNITGAETGTSDANAEREAIDRYANRFVPVVLAYLLVGTYETVALATDLPAIVATVPAQASHLLAAGTGGLLVLAVGARLLPRFFVAHPPVWAVRVMLPAGAIGPALLTIGFAGGTLFQIGALLQAIALGCFAIVVASLARASDRQRVGLYGVTLGAIGGVAGVAVGLTFAFGTGVPSPAIHHRLTIAGFLGLTIVGVLFQFYPPGIGRSAGVNDRTAALGLAAIAAGLGAEVLGTWTVNVFVTGGQWLVLAGAVAVAYVVLGLVIDRRRR